MRQYISELTKSVYKKPFDMTEEDWEKTVNRIKTLIYFCLKVLEVDNNGN